MSKAIIASDIEANAEVVKDGKTGLLVPTQSPEDLAKAILTLFKDAQLAKTLGQQAYEEASSNLQLSDMTLKVEEVYLRNLHQGRVFGRLVRRTTYKVPN
jgi:glycosyltransferase involved in cell wall biosynthesis